MILHENARIKKIVLPLQEKPKWAFQPQLNHMLLIYQAWLRSKERDSLVRLT